MSKTHWKVRLTRDRLMELLSFDEGTGDFTWLKDRRCVRAGRLAGTINNHGYVAIKVDGILYTGHRLAWLWMTGKFPAEEIDHINRIRRDNRPENLREATSSQNKANGGSNRRNTSGIKGVSYAASRGKYIAQISVDGRVKNLGGFETITEAEQAHKAAAASFYPEFRPQKERA